MAEDRVGWEIPGPPQSEGRFGAVSELCPHPEYWTSTDADSTECEVSELIAGLVRGLQPDYLIETGAAWGQTTEAIGLAVLANGHGLLVSLEPDLERGAATSKRCEGLPVIVMAHESLQWTPANAVIDFAFFDSQYELRVPEFLHFRPYMHTGTIVAFHDSAPGHGAHRIPSGRDLRDEIAAELGHELRFVHLATPRGITVGEVL